MSESDTAALPQDLRNMGYPVCDRAAAEIERLRAELSIRKRQIGLMGNCLSHIQGSAVAPEPIRIAATAALAGASELTREIANAE